jgi:hypothetical protein
MDAWVEGEAMRLLRMMDDLQAKGQEGACVSPSEVAAEAGLDPGPSAFERVVDHLEDEGAIVRDERFDTLSGAGLYQMTRRGLEMLAQAERP